MDTVIFTIGTQIRERQGHGQSEDVVSVRKTGPFREEQFPPCFGTREEAEKYLADTNHGVGYDTGRSVVELQLRQATNGNRLDAVRRKDGEK